MLQGGESQRVCEEPTEMIHNSGWLVGCVVLALALSMLQVVNMMVCVGDVLVVWEVVVQAVFLGYAVEA